MYRRVIEVTAGAVTTHRYTDKRLYSKFNVYVLDTAGAATMDVDVLTPSDRQQSPASNTMTLSSGTTLKGTDTVHKGLVFTPSATSNDLRVEIIAWDSVGNV